MKVLDDITNEVIQEDVAVKVTFHPYNLENHCLTVDIENGKERFKKKTMFVSRTTAHLMLLHINGMKERFKEDELDQVEMFEDES